MTKKEYLEFHKRFCTKMLEISVAKNADYTGETEDPFANFRICEDVGVTDIVSGMLVRMLDKVARVKSFNEKGTLKVKDESVNDTLMDLANYSVLLAGVIEDAKAKNKGRTS